MIKKREIEIKEMDWQEVSAEMFRREIMDYGKKQIESVKYHKKNLFELEKKIVLSKDLDDLQELKSRVFWEEWHISKAKEKISLIENVLRELGFKFMEDVISIKESLIKELQKKEVEDVK